MLVTSLNKYLDTTQIHMTRREWDKINFDNVTAQTIHKSKNSFMNQKNINKNIDVYVKIILLIIFKNVLIMKNKLNLGH